MSEEDILAKLELNLKLLNSINIKLDKLVNRETVSKIVETLKAEEGETSVEVNSPMSSRSGMKTNITDSTPSEVVLMDLSDLTVMAQTDKSMLVSKKGKQKWVAFSLMLNGNPGVEDGTFLNGIDLTEKAETWFHKKGWDKLEVRKR